MLLIGVVSGWLIWGQHEGEESSTYHWDKVNKYREFIANPSNYTKQDQYLVSGQVPVVMPHLEALVAMNELNKLVAIIPELPNEKEHIHAWMRFCQHPGIIEATAPGVYQRGEIPLMFTVWYKDEAKADLMAFVESLRAKGRQKKDAGEQAAPSNGDKPPR